MIGQTLAHYKILEKVGSGGMGDVYLAEDTKLDRKVTLKVLPPELAQSEERRARFTREAKALAALDHPNIVQVFSVKCRKFYPRPGHRGNARRSERGAGRRAPSSDLSRRTADRRARPIVVAR